MAKIIWTKPIKAEYSKGLMAAPPACGQGSAETLCAGEGRDLCRNCRIYKEKNDKQ